MSSNPSRLRRRVGHGGLSLLVLATGSTLLWSASAGPASADPVSGEPVCAAGTCVVSFAATGAVQTWTVPTGVTSLTATLAGAAGGSPAPSTAGGSGGQTVGTIAVQPGDLLGLVTGGSGRYSATSSTGAVGGYGGGGAGGDNSNVPAAPGGTSGGGGSFLFDGSTLLLAAGGGGGSAGGLAGGAGGGAVAAAAGAGTDSGFGALGGQPGTIAANGLGGPPSGTGGTGDATSSTTLPVGGSGGSSAPQPFPLPTNNGAPGSGGGGGYHAGGGGSGPIAFLPGIPTAGAGGGGGAGFADDDVTGVTGTAGVQAGDGQITLSYDGVKAQGITFTSSPDNAIVGRTGYSVSAEGTGPPPVVFSVDPATTNGACTLDGVDVTFVHVGTCVIAGDEAADAQHTAGHNVQSFVVGQGNQTLTFAPLPLTGAIGDVLPLVATGETHSGSPVVFSVGAATTLGACTVDDATLTLTGAGTCAVLVAQPWTVDYKAAITLDQEVTVSRVATTTAVTFDEDNPVFGQPVTATATVTGVAVGTVQFSVDGDPVGDPVDLADGKASLALTATLGATGHPVKAAFTPTDTDTYAASSSTVTLAVGQAMTKSTIKVRSDEASVTVTAVAPGTGTPDGTVVFTVGDDTPSAPVTLVHGKATLPGTVPADTDVSVAYGGDDDFAKSSDSTLRQNPTIEAAVSSEVGKSPAGWYRTPVKVTFTCDAGSAPLTGACPAPVTLSGDGASQSVTRTVTADDGGIATASVTGLNIDRTKPVVTALFVKEGDRYFAEAPDAGCFATDALSGVLGCSGSRKVKDKAVTYSVAAADQAGNVSTLEVHATIYVRGITDAPYADGVYTVKAGQTYTLVAQSSSRPRVLKPTKGSKKPSKNGAKFVSTGDDTWALGYTIGSSLKPGTTYNLGIRTSHKYAIKIHVIA